MNMYCPKCGCVTNSTKCEACSYELGVPVIALNDHGLSNIITLDSYRITMYIEGEKYYNNKQFQEARAKYEASAKQGYDKAQNKLGLMCILGQGGIINVEEGLRWLKISESQGGSDACKIIAYLYEKGIGVHRNYDEALKYYSKAAKKGDSIAKQRIAAIENLRDDSSLKHSLLTEFVTCINIYIEKEIKMINELLAKRERLIVERNRFSELEEQLNREIEEERAAAQKAQDEKKIRKVGPNDPCPCGSGKKYKLCHGLKRDKDGAIEQKKERENPIITDKDVLLQEIALYSVKEIASAISNVSKTRQTNTSNFSENRIDILNQMLNFLRQTFGNKELD